MLQTATRVIRIKDRGAGQTLVRLWSNETDRENKLTKSEKMRQQNIFKAAFKISQHSIHPRMWWRVCVIFVALGIFNMKPKLHMFV